MPTSLFNLHEAHGISQYATGPPGLCAPVAEAGAVSLEEEAASPELEATGALKLVMDMLTSWDANDASLSVGGASLIVPAALVVAAAVSLVEDRASASGAHVSSMVCVARQDRSVGDLSTPRPLWRLQSFLTINFLLLSHQNLNRGQDARANRSRHTTSSSTQPHAKQQLTNAPQTNLTSFSPAKSR